MQDFWGVSVRPARLICFEVSHGLRAKVCYRSFLPGTRDAGDGDDRKVRLNELVRHGRQSPKGDRCGETSRNCHPVCAAQRFPVARHLRNSIGPASGIVAAVEGIPVGLATEAKIGCTIDHGGLLAQLLCDVNRMSVR